MRSIAALSTPGSTQHEPGIKSPVTIPRRNNKSGTSRSGSPTPKNRASKFSGSTAVPVLPSFVEAPYDPVMIPAVLSFSFEEAKSHLINADDRFAIIFAKLPCRPYEHLEPVDPFQCVAPYFLWVIHINCSAELW